MDIPENVMIRIASDALGTLVVARLLFTELSLQQLY